jgi:hypothetical protein
MTVISMVIVKRFAEQLLDNIPNSYQELKNLIELQPIRHREPDYAYPEWKYKEVVCANAFKDTLFGITVDAGNYLSMPCWGIVTYSNSADNLGGVYRNDPKDTGIETYIKWLKLLTTP